VSHGRGGSKRGGCDSFPIKAEKKKEGKRGPAWARHAEKKRRGPVTHALKQGRVGRPAMARFWQRQAVDERGARVRRGVARAWRGPVWGNGRWPGSWGNGK
jgi:hypothetical protein